MNLQFATCVPETALEFINKMYPNNEDLTKDEIPELIDLIKRDILRVQDPNFHQPCQIVAGKKYQSSDDEEIGIAIDKFKELI